MAFVWRAESFVRVPVVHVSIIHTSKYTVALLFKIAKVCRRLLQLHPLRDSQQLGVNRYASSKHGMTPIDRESGTGNVVMSRCKYVLEHGILEKQTRCRMYEPPTETGRLFICLPVDENVFTDKTRLCLGGECSVGPCFCSYRKLVATSYTLPHALTRASLFAPATCPLCRNPAVLMRFLCLRPPTSLAPIRPPAPPARTGRRRCPR